MSNHYGWHSNIVYTSFLTFTSTTIHRTFANETTQFLAPYEVSQQKTSQLGATVAAAALPTTTATLPPFSSVQNVPAAGNPKSHPNAVDTSQSNVDLVGGMTGPERSEPAVRKGLGKWNPFEDPTPFSQMTADHIIDAEFDAIRQRGGSQSSEL